MDQKKETFNNQLTCRVHGDLPTDLRRERVLRRGELGRGPGLPDHPRQQLPQRGQTQLQADCGRAVQGGAEAGVRPCACQEMSPGETEQCSQCMAITSA